MIKCAHCATPVPDDARFCHNCGSQVSDAEGQAAATAAMDRSAFAHMEQLLREDTAGEFEIERLLGRGGMAVVYLATEIHLSRKVAIKVLPPELTFGHGVERFMREAKTAAALDHPNIIPIYRISSGGRIFWYAMKFLEGRSLEDILKEKGKLSLEETVQILSQVADALDYAHERQVIHRDIKPANVMLDSRNRVVVTDFGIAKALTEGTLTASGSVVGTPYYMSPEQGMGKGVTGRSDQYSVGVMAYRMLSGQVPFEGDSAIDILHKHVMVPPPPLQESAPGLPAHVYRAVHKALEKKPEARFSTVTEFVRALQEPGALEAPAPEISDAVTVAVPAGMLGTAEAKAAQLPTTKAPARDFGAKAPARGRPPAARPAPKRGKAVVLALSVAVIAGAALGAWVLMQQGASSSGEPPAGEPPARASGTETPTPEGSLDRPRIGAATPAASAAETTAGAAGLAGGTALPVQGDTTQAAASREPTPAGRQAAGPQQAGPARTPPPAARPTTGRLVIRNLPSGAMVAIDGRRREGTVFDLPPGEHTVRMGGAGYPAIVEVINIAAGREHTLVYRSQGAAVATGRPPPADSEGARAAAAERLATVQLRIQPWARLIVDGVDHGEQSRWVDTLLPGVHVFVFEREGFVRKDTTLTLRPGDNVRMVIRMIPER